MSLILRLVAVIGAAGFSALAHAAPGDPIDLQMRVDRYYRLITLDDQARATEVSEWSRVVLKKSALDELKTASFSFSTSAQQGEVIAAYTQKADGRRIDVPKNNYQFVINRGEGQNSPVYSDETTITVVFPELEVGDSEVVSYRIVDLQPLFPGKYSETASFSKDRAYGDVRITFDFPAQLAATFDSNGMSQAEPEAAPGRKRIEWTYSNPRPVESDRRNWSVVDVDQQTHFSFTTFASYEEIATAYGDRAKPKAAVTDRIRELASQIVGNTQSPRDQAKALYEWVATNINYAGNCIGIGSVVPRDLAFVLDNRIGDCKDHATLLQALLEARGIQSTQALINAGSVYRLPRTPVVATVNHVINYIPSLSLFADSTSDHTPFGLLPSGDQGKPVLLVHGYKAGLLTPVATPESNAQTMRSDLTVGIDGQVAGYTEVYSAGNGAASVRAWARQLTRNTEQNLVRDMFRRQGMIGSGSLTKDDPTELSDKYHYKLDFTLEKYLKLPGAGAFYVASPTQSPAVANLLQFTSEPETSADVVCWSGTGRDEYAIHFPKGLQILSVPDDVQVGNAYVSYEAHYRTKGNVLTVTRSLTNKMAGNMCSPAIAAEYRKIEEEIFDDLRSQVLYKLPKHSKPRKG